MNDETLSKHDHILLGLVMSLQMAAMQQLGKIKNEMSGEIERDLTTARATIDMLEMLKVKCRTDTPAGVLRILDTAVMDLQMNYLDEVKKDQAPPPPSAATTDTPDAAGGEASA